MKNQYVADINDYRKYGLIRALSGSGSIRTGVCWMLTPDDHRTDGQFTNYINSPERWSKYDPRLFDHLARCLRDGDRHVRRIEHDGLLPNCAFHSDLLTDLTAGRHRYFARMLAQLADADLIFFDPDNGLEIKSLPLGRKHSSKFLYWHELVSAFDAGKSVLVYQHFIREKRDLFIVRLASQIAKHLAPARIYSFRTAHVVFFLASQATHADFFEKRVSIIANHWKGQIEVLAHDQTLQEKGC